MSEPCHEKCKFVLLALVVPSSELQDLPSFTTGAGFVAANVAHFDRHLTEKQQKKLNLLLPFTIRTPTGKAASGCPPWSTLPSLTRASPVSPTTASSTSPTGSAPSSDSPATRRTSASTEWTSGRPSAPWEHLAHVSNQTATIF